ncbi:MAG: NAD(P)-dependent oxidoreductase [Candidatus Lokiarchaeota archaeon]|nr:NAD(P)-dependent oxidoreductase [Candidatus Lokiarchaeota archaeon]
MKKKVLLTGAFGNVGQNTLKQLLMREHEVSCFDLPNPSNKKIFKKLSKKLQFTMHWGNILNKDDLKKAVEGVECIIHLAAIIPPLSELNPELARKVNVEGTQNLIEAAKTLPDTPRFIMASSASVHGVTMHLEPPVTADSPLNPSDHYSTTKVECEKMVKASGLPWLVLRLGAVSVDKMPFKLEGFADLLFSVPLEQRAEFVASNDCAIAFANAVMIDKIDKVFLIGGGVESQLYQGDFLAGFFDAFGLKMLPEKAFKPVKTKDDWLYVDWMDTKESQENLKYLTEPFPLYVDRMKKNHKLRRIGIKIISPLAKRFLLRMSPYLHPKTKKEE